MLSRINNIRFSLPRCSAYIISFDPHKNPFWMGASIPILQRKKLNLREVQWHTQVCTVSKRRTLNPNPKHFALCSVQQSGSFGMTKQGYITQCFKKLQRSRDKGTGLSSLSSGSLTWILKTVWDLGLVGKKWDYIPELTRRTNRVSETVRGRVHAGDSVWMCANYINSWRNFPEWLSKFSILSPVLWGRRCCVTLRTADYRCSETTGEMACDQSMLLG